MGIPPLFILLKGPIELFLFFSLLGLGLGLGILRILIPIYVCLSVV